MKNDDDLRCIQSDWRDHFEYVVTILVVWGAWKVVPISLERYGLVRFEVLRSVQV